MTFCKSATEKKCTYQENEEGDGNIKVTSDMSIDPTSSSYKDCSDDPKRIVKILPGNYNVIYLSSLF